MQISKLTSTDGFVAIDLPEAELSVGVLRCARKILQDGAVNLARTATYSFASFGFPFSGASAAVNAIGDARDEAVSLAVSELAERVAAGTPLLRPGKGISGADLDSWNPRIVTSADEDLARTADSICAAAGALRPLGNATVVIDDIGPLASVLIERFTAMGATATVAPDADAVASVCDVLVVGTKPGQIDHEVAAGLATKLVVPSGPMPVTARGLAVAQRNGVVVVPDFVSLAGPYIALGDAASANTDAGSIADRVHSALTDVIEHPEGLYLGACYAAEDCLRTWATALPFGRPMA